MRLPFENWLQEQELPEESEVAFTEAVLTYKAGAYRAALLFSFVGMGLCLRRRLLSAKPPAGIEQAQWDAILRKLQSEDSWDTQVFDCTQRHKVPTLFEVEDHVREEMKYWKNRRNDCAHFKRNEIGAPHVEAFWLFLRSNLSRWVPNGSVPDLLEKISVHFDPNYTPRGADASPLVRLIPHAVPETELAQFFEDLVATLTRKIGTLALPNSEALAVVFSSILQIAPTRYAAAAGDWLRSNPERLLDVLRHSPQHVAALHGHPKSLRSLWHNQLFSNGRQDLHVLCALLRGALIPPEEVEESITRAINHLNGQLPDQQDELILRNAGFWLAFDQKAFTEKAVNSFNWGNPNAQLIAWRLQVFPLSPNIAQVVCSTFEHEPYPDQAKDAIRVMLVANPGKMAELTGLAKGAGMSVPASLQ